MSLREYRRKRNFQATPEPRGDAAPARAKGLSYVIQKHAASRLHYDFRLEWDGVLKSWAVPKGPSLDPREKRLAVMTEDHPIEYGDFEGTIPEGEYGGGTVLLWDRGTWQPRDDPGEGLRQGKLVFSIQGQKLHGGWALVKLKGGNRAGGDWLLVKEKDEEARKGAAAEIASREPLSVASGRELEEVARDRGRTWASARRRRAASRATVPRPGRRRREATGREARVGGAPPARRSAAARPLVAQRGRRGADEVPATPGRSAPLAAAPGAAARRRRGATRPAPRAWGRG